jgi:hypothetical protein
MKDLLGNRYQKQPVHINIYADEVQNRICPYTNNSWHYIGIILENTKYLLLPDILEKRFCGNPNKHSEYYSRNNRVVHWKKIKSVDTKNICKRWLEYILTPNLSRNTFYSCILGLNNSYLNREEFNTQDEFNSKYNRFFRSALLYAVKRFWGNRQIIVDNFYHEQGQQEHSDVFPWHVIYKLRKQDRVDFNCNEVTFLPKDHKEDERSNIIQLCDIVLGISTGIIHGFEESNQFVKYRKELVNLYLPLLKRLMNNPKNTNSHYEYYRRMMISFFPRERTTPDDVKRCTNQFYCNRALRYEEDQGPQELLI